MVYRLLRGLWAVRDGVECACYLEISDLNPNRHHEQSFPRPLAAIDLQVLVAAARYLLLEFNSQLGS